MADITEYEMRNIVLTIATQAGASEGAISVQEANAVLNGFLAEGYRFVSANAIPNSAVAGAVSIWYLLMRSK